MTPRPGGAAGLAAPGPGAASQTALQETAQQSAGQTLSSRGSSLLEASTTQVCGEGLRGAQATL